ncbi:MAG: TIGR03618 family F420-dependent PPOX class oxidoreductase [Anaerolineae bacterium]|nr:MAG: TIGR03618 family F420-dependent PPOX class oxidoreductase [Anaerolineae bacterium]
MSMNQIPEHMRYLLDDATRAYLFLSTLMRDGSPQATVLWFDTDGEHLRANIRQDSVKARNLQRDPRVAVVIPDPNDSNTYIQLRGRVAGWQPEGAAEHLAALGEKYEGAPYADPGYAHVILSIEIEKVYVN